MDIAKIHAESAIRQRKEASNTMKFGAKMGALGGKIEGAYRAQAMSATMANCVPAIQKSMKMMDKMGLSEQMKDFEKVFEDMDVKTGEMDAAMDNVYEGTIDANAVNQLL